MDLIEGNLEDPISHWYYSHKFYLLRQLLEKDLRSATVLADVGAGSALFSKELTRIYPKLNCLAVDTGYLDEVLDNSTNRISYHKEVVNCKANIYLFTDVLEHVLDDKSMLLTYTKSAPMGSAFLLTVPAHMFLWSGHDVFLKHYRRYSKNDFEELILNSGLKIEKSQYIYTFLVPAALLLRKLPRSKRVESQMKPTSNFVNIVLRGLLIMEQILPLPKPFGVSIVILARK